MRFPKQYRPMEAPKNSNKRGEPRYVVSMDCGHGVYGDIDGPYLSIEEALNYLPSTDTNHIIYHADLVERLPLYRWRIAKQLWQRIRTDKVWVFHSSSCCFAICNRKELDNGELDEIGPAVEYHKNELRELLKGDFKNSHLLYRFEIQEEETPDDVPF